MVYAAGGSLRMPLASLIRSARFMVKTLAGMPPLSLCTGVPACSQHGLGPNHSTGLDLGPARHNLKTD